MNDGKAAFYLLGKTLKHSFSPEIHKLLGNCNYTKKEIEECALESFVRGGEFGGLNVTIPYKRAVIPFLDCLSETAERTGVVNTVVNRNGRLTGYNTDFFGFSYLAETENVCFRDKKVLILGSGATAATAARYCSENGAAYTFVSRKKGVGIGYADCYSAKDCNIIVNATPCGMYPDNGSMPVSPDRFANLEAVIDCVYNPLKTRLVLYAEKLGIRAVGGLKMLAAQAVKSNALFFGLNGGFADADSVFKKILAQKRNIVLIGAAGAGKSAIGRALAVKTGKIFADVDALIEKKENMTAENIIETFGESYFREREREAVKEISALNGAVTATGGGTVLDEENMFDLKQNGITVYVKRDLQKIDASHRPLYKAKSVGALFEERRALYEKYADYAVDNDAAVDGAADKIAEIIK